MDVDEEDEVAENVAHEDEDVELDSAEEGDRTKRSKHKGKSKAKQRRKSQLDMEALQNEAVAVAVLQSDQLQQVRLKRKYYAECLNFIRQMEGGMKIVEQLLASTSKAEVLESMEFFRVLHEYQLDGAEVSAHMRVAG